ncbi:amino acid ABC transporter permease [Arthrobacter wenxiniae]|jgi:His/Glu/Gln/Arg/opine family amino acid ABC transporter permease subunit|uniref:Amino acid ABC transporter permease n=1 Tax=Arthrobacter wenxiniae TaxID=2713570 RepID=A0A7Y7M0E7_9MICC|nr:amino acid ABC transporter permease [Arthrobacter wenxiniae]NVM95648.1 amino acid ABC transporter permease [Arthrobacter wenxiniae]
MEMLKAIAIGLPLTVLVTILALMIGTVVALPIVAGLRSRNRLIWLMSRGLVDLLRGIPPVVWLFMLYYGISIGAVRLSALQAGVLGLGVVAAAYLAEIFRGAISAVPKGQWEASSALGFHRATVWTRIVGPQTARAAIPAYTTFAIGLLKDSSIASTIGVSEIVFMSSQYARQSGSGILVFFVAAGIYILLSVPLGLLSRHLDVKMRKAVAR